MSDEQGKTGTNRLGSVRGVCFAKLASSWSRQTLFFIWVDQGLALGLYDYEGYACETCGALDLLAVIVPPSLSNDSMLSMTSSHLKVVPAAFEKRIAIVVIAGLACIVGARRLLTRIGNEEAWAQGHGCISQRRRLCSSGY